MNTHHFPIRVYYEDTDHGGVVYYANYLKFMERGRTEFLRTHGIELDQVQRDLGMMFVVTEVNIRYKGAARFNDMLDIESGLIRASGARIGFTQHINRLEGDEPITLTQASVQLACVNKHGKPCLIPKQLLSLLQQYIHKEV